MFKILFEQEKLTFHWNIIIQHTTLLNHLTRELSCYSLISNTYVYTLIFFNNFNLS